MFLRFLRFSHRDRQGGRFLLFPLLYTECKIKHFPRFSPASLAGLFPRFSLVSLARLFQRFASASMIGPFLRFHQRLWFGFFRALHQRLLLEFSRAFRQRLWLSFPRVLYQRLLLGFSSVFTSTYGYPSPAPYISVVLFLRFSPAPMFGSSPRLTPASSVGRFPGF